MWYLLLFIVLIVLAYVFYQKIYGGDDLTFMQNSIIGGNEKTVAEWMYIKYKPDGRSRSGFQHRVCAELSKNTTDDVFNKFYLDPTANMCDLNPNRALEYLNIIKSTSKSESDKNEKNIYISTFIYNYLDNYKSVLPLLVRKNDIPIISPISKLFDLFKQTATDDIKKQLINANIVTTYKEFITSLQNNEKTYQTGLRLDFEKDIIQKIKLLLTQLETSNVGTTSEPPSNYVVWLNRLNI